MPNDFNVEKSAPLIATSSNQILSQKFEASFPQETRLYKPNQVTAEQKAAALKLKKLMDDLLQALREERLLYFGDAVKEDLIDNASNIKKIIGCINPATGEIAIGVIFKSDKPISSFGRIRWLSWSDTEKKFRPVMNGPDLFPDMKNERNDFVRFYSSIHAIDTLENVSVDSLSDIERSQINYLREHLPLYQTYLQQLSNRFIAIVK